MALIIKDRVQETSNTTGTGTLTLGGAVTGYQSFGSAIGNGNTTYYGIYANGYGDWEVGIGTVTVTGGTTTLARTTVLASSNAGSLVNFTNVPLSVWGDMPAAKGVYADANGNTSWSNEAPGYTNYVTSGQTISLTASSTYYQHFSGSSTATLKLPDETTIPVGLAYIIDNDSSANITVQDSGGNLLTTVTPGMAGYIYSLSNSAATGNWAGYIFPPGNNATGTPITWGTSGLNMAGTGIDNAVIGATTPNTGTFTTITGQTEVLKGTGENLLTYSQAYTSGTWGLTNGVLTGTQSDPIGGSTAFLFAENTTNGTHILQLTPSPTFPNSVTYTYSQYVKSGVKNQLVLGMSDNTTGNAYALFDTNAGTTSNIGTGITGLGIGSWTNLSATITSVGSGWYRCSLTATKNAGNQISAQMYQVTSSSISYAGTTGAGVYVWGSQLEIGSVTNTYVPTTTTAVYGTPTLSFSGVAGLGLQSDGSLYVSPAGTGALQAQATTSSTVGGNARGANAVDWQTFRTAATNVASGSYATLAGGYGSTVNGYAAFNGGGINNTSSGLGAFTGGGQGATATRDYAVSVGGLITNSTGFFNFIGGGASNSGTANAVVTTQAAATNGVTSGSTAVTLSGSNASIKVGQLITGTGIVSYTYVAAISGTALTLSQNANATGTPTLSFYTPHGVVVGGGNNQATGSYSFIGGGGDAGTAANRNVASGDWSAILGGRGGTTRGITGYQAFPACSIPIASGAGYSQGGLLVLGTQTTNATATVLTSDGNAATTTNQVILPNNSAYSFRVTIIAGVTGAGNTSSWILQGAIKRGGTASTTAIVGAVNTTLLAQDSGASTWAVSATADTTNGGLAITVTGQASTTIRWVAKAESVEMTY